MALPEYAWGQMAQQQVRPGINPATKQWDPFYFKGPKWGMQDKLLDILGQVFGQGGAGGGGGGQGFQFLQPGGQPYGGVFPGGYQTGIQGGPAWSGRQSAAAKKRLTGGAVGDLGGLFSGGQAQALSEGLLGAGASAFGDLDRGATAADRALQFATESAQARAGIGGQQLAGGLEALGRRKQMASLPYLLSLLPFA